MELKVGMYIITNDRMKIGQIKGFCTCEMCEKRGFYEPIINGDIIITDYDKSQGFHGYRFYDNPINLIEVGDVIETPKGIFQVGYIENNVIYTDDSKVIACLRKDEHLCFENTIIKSIVTKEQFAFVKYEVE